MIKPMRKFTPTFALILLLLAGLFVGPVAAQSLNAARGNPPYAWWTTAIGEVSEALQATLGNGVDPQQASLDWIGMPVRPRFLRNSKFKPTDIYFVPR